MVGVLYVSVKIVNGNLLGVIFRFLGRKEIFGVSVVVFKFKIFGNFKEGLRDFFGKNRNDFIEEFYKFGVNVFFFKILVCEENEEYIIG